MCVYILKHNVLLVDLFTVKKMKYIHITFCHLPCTLKRYLDSVLNQYFFYSSKIMSRKKFAKFFYNLYYFIMPLNWVRIYSNHQNLDVLFPISIKGIKMKIMIFFFHILLYVLLLHIPCLFLSV